MKPKYAIPYNINANLFNSKTSLKDDKTGTGFDKKFSVRTLITFIIATVFYGWLVMQSSASKILMPSSGSWSGFILFTVGYVGMAYFSLREISIPEQYGYNVFKPLINWLQIRKKPEVSTKRFDPYMNGAKITGMLEPTDDGYLRFTDGSYGITYRIVGTASVNAFSVDRENSINSFKTFLQNMPKETTLTFITNTGGQKVERQLKHLFELYNKETNVAIIQYISEEIRELARYVQDNFFALHQYMIIRGDSRNALKTAEKQIKSFVQRDGSVISIIERPKPEEERKLFHTIFSGLEYEDNAQLDEFMKQDHYRKSEVEMAGSRMADVEHKKKIDNRINIKKRTNNQRSTIQPNHQPRRQNKVHPTYTNRRPTNNRPTIRRRKVIRRR